MQEVVESQLSVASSKSAQQLKMIDEANKFLNMSHAKRLEVVKKLTEEITKEKKTKRDAIEFLDAIQMCVYKQGDVKSSRFSLETIETARRYIHDRAPSVKMLLEYVALNV